MTNSSKVRSLTCRILSDMVWVGLPLVGLEWKEASRGWTSPISHLQEVPPQVLPTLPNTDPVCVSACVCVCAKPCFQGSNLKQGDRAL